MNFFWVVMISWLVIGGTAEARLGETESELIDRFGPVRQRDDRLRLIGFLKDEYLVCFQILDGRAEAMIFGYIEPYTQLHEAQVRHLLELYSDGSAWLEDEASETEAQYHLSDGTRFAIWEKIPKTIKRPNLRIMTGKGKQWLEQYQKRYVHEKMSGF